MLFVKMCLVIAIAYCASAGRVEAQNAVFPDENGRALAGVSRFDARFIVGTWLEMDRARDVFERSAQTSFELALRRDGVVVAEDAPNYLFCEVKAADADGIVAYSYAVQYYEFSSSGVHSLQWEHGGMATIGANKFTPDETVNDCVRLFANEWLRWNPKR